MQTYFQINVNHIKCQIYFMKNGFLYLFIKTKVHISLDKI
jgi:hypothetical protein